MSDVPPPIKPGEPEYEDLSTIADQPHNWGRYSDGWESGCHAGHTCKACDEMSDCVHCNPDALKDLGCLREQADNRNRDRKRAFNKAVERYEAQMDYYREITGQ